MKYRFFILTITLGLTLMVLESVGWSYQSGQESKKETSGGGVIKLQSTLVQVPVIVSGTGGRYITDLTRKDFLLYEDGVKQEIELFGSVEEPFGVALLLDSSGSTTDQLREIKQAAMAFVENLRDHDKVMVVGFNDSVEVMCDLTSDRDVLRRAISAIEPGEYTQVYDALYTAVWERLQDVAGRKAVILFTDGIDTASTEISGEDTLDAIVESEDIIVYPIRYNTRSDVERKLAKKQAGGSGNVQIDFAREEKPPVLDRLYRGADEYLQQLADLSGGVLERADQLGDLKAAFARIANELRHQYLLGYYPSAPDNSGSNRRISVQVKREGVRVRARPGYER